MIADLTRTLDQRLENEQRPAERTRMLREATNQITRTANDAIQAYHRARASVKAELEMPEGDHAHAKRMGAQLEVARKDVLVALETTSHRYPSSSRPNSAQKLARKPGSEYRVRPPSASPMDPALSFVFESAV